MFVSHFFLYCVFKLAVDYSTYHSFSSDFRFFRLSVLIRVHLSSEKLHQQIRYCKCFMLRSAHIVKVRCELQYFLYLLFFLIVPLCLCAFCASEPGKSDLAADLTCSPLPVQPSRSRHLHCQDSKKQGYRDNSS